MGRIEMSKEELRKVEVLARVKSGALRVKDAAALLGLSYRQAKRLWKRYRQEGAGGMKHRSAGQRSNRAYAASLPWIPVFKPIDSRQNLRPALPVL